jgi:iron complex outermembrane receptor protein
MPAPRDFDATIDDPCTSAAGGSFQTNTTVRANCIANGVPANGSYAEPTGGQLGVFSQGNVNLKPETAKTWTAGGVYSPELVAHRRLVATALSLEVNWYSIKLTNAIDSVPATLTLSRCAFNADPVSCAAITPHRQRQHRLVSARGCSTSTAIETSGARLARSPTARPQVAGGTVGLARSTPRYLLKYNVAAAVRPRFAAAQEYRRHRARQPRPGLSAASSSTARSTSRRRPTAIVVHRPLHQRGRRA